ncbi:MAG: hypoxanthine phosphoribosyltransferase [Candidatus Latescibacteria bacterium]|nr:hypoxanthine phosphoribosyltransferase [Candidatus Latescibacterota bacterium]
MQPLISAAQLAEKVRELGARISDDYQATCPALVGILKGSVVFLADLMRAVSVPHTIEFLIASSYGTSTTSSGVVRIQSLGEKLQGRHVLLVEDIVDTGRTLQYIVSYLSAQQPESLRVCALLDKPSARRVDVKIDYVGFTIPDVFVVGYGLDVNEQYRHLPYIAAVPAGDTQRPSARP